MRKLFHQEFHPGNIKLTSTEVFVYPCSWFLPTPAVSNSISPQHHGFHQTAGSSQSAVSPDFLLAPGL